MKSAWLWAIALILFGLVNGSMTSGVAAQTGGDTEKERLQQEIDRLKLEIELTKERANLEKATAERIRGLGIPSFEGKAKTDTNAGNLEASMLSAEAVSRVAELIANRLMLHRVEISERDNVVVPRNACGLPSGAARSANRTVRANARFLILASQEPFDFGVVDFVRGQLVAICSRFIQEIPESDLANVWVRTTNENRSDLISDLSLPVQVATALFGAIRSDVDIRTVTTSAITDALLARSIAERLQTRAVLATAPTMAPANRAIRPDSVEGLLAQLYLIRARAVAFRDSDAMKGDAHKDQRDRISQLVTRFDNFVTSITTPDARGNLMLARAAQLERLMAEDSAGVRPHILRVHVDQSGGSLIETKNIGTFIGADPLRISGGLVASFTVTHAETAQVLAAGVFACRTALVRLRRVHDGTWSDTRAGTNPPGPVCVPGQ